MSQNETPHDESAVPSSELPKPNDRSAECLATLAHQCRAEFAKDFCDVSERAVAAFSALAEHYDQLSPKVERIRSVAPQFDFSADVAANGYRSLLFICDRQVALTASTCRQLVMFAGTRRLQRSRTARQLLADLESWCQWTASMCVLFGHLETLLQWSSDGSLFPDDKHSPIELLKKAGDVNQYCFYGRMMGMQFDDSMRPVLQRIARFMCMYSHYFYNTGSSFRRWATASLFFRRIMNDPEYRAKRIVNISRYADIDFCKGFWSQQESEFIQMYPEVVGPPLAVNITIGLPPEKLVLPSIESTDGNNATVSVEPPTAHLGPDSVHCRLLCARRRDGMLGGGKAHQAVTNKARTRSADLSTAASPYLIFHCHGGGFVAQSSKSHEVYLREWATELDAPIFSIDYSLAPDAPFPRACEEVFYAYCWALKQCALLGSTGRRIVVVGDSAGGNLVTTVTLEALRRGIRPPDAQLLIYTPFNISFVPSPARLQCLLDPLLPLGFLMRCLHAYAGHARADNWQSHAADSPTAGAGANVPAAQPTAETDSFRDPSVDVNYTLNPKRRRLGHRLANRDLDTLAADPLSTEFQYFSVSADPRLSPYLADDRVLSRCPRTHIITCHMDPCLDDCVAMARRWRCLNVPVQLTVLEGVCHGFLNFSRFSAAAQKGSDRCVQLLSELLSGETDE